MSIRLYTTMHLFQNTTGRKPLNTNFSRIVSGTMTVWFSYTCIYCRVSYWVWKKKVFLSFIKYIVCYALEIYLKKTKKLGFTTHKAAQAIQSIPL